MYIDQCTYLRNQSTIAIQGTNACLDAKINDTLKETYRCDKDGDGIPDVCDNDIDGDGIPNLIGLIAFENKDCSIVIDQNDPKMNINLDMLKKHYQGVCSLDNAPFDSNADQLDLNQDGIGDAQEKAPVLGSGEALDSDGDGIPDAKDLCPAIQETRNGISDEDGCPEIDAELACNEITL